MKPMPPWEVKAGRVRSWAIAVEFLPFGERTGEGEQALTLRQSWHAASAPPHPDPLPGGERENLSPHAIALGSARVTRFWRPARRRVPCP